VVGIPILIFVVAFGVGFVVPAQWLPDLAGGRVGRLALIVVCGLLGVTVALIALHVYEIVRQLDQLGAAGLPGNTKPDVVASGIATMLRDIGPILGLAAAVYLLAPAPIDDDPPAST
jgi:hypothetical protein